MIRVLQATALALVVQSPIALQHPAELTLDVVTIPPPDEQRVRGYGCGCYGGTSDPIPPSVKVTLLEITPRTLAFADNIVFELSIEHVGRLPIPIATTRDAELEPDCETKNGRVTTYFALFSKGSNEIIAVGPALYGSRAQPGTTMILHPGERLRVRVPATVARMDRRPLSEDPQLLDLYASFHTRENPCRSVFERSPNALAIQLSRPRRPN
jgi:hypothetical protein